MSDGVIHGHFRFESGILISTMISSSYYILINVYGIKSIVRSRNTILNIMYFGWRKYNTEPILSVQFTLLSGCFPNIPKFLE